MISEEIENCIAKYLSQSADMDDLDVLDSWIGDETHQKIFKAYVKANFAINLTMNEPDINEIRERLLKEIRKEKTPFYKRKKFVSVIKYAAIAILFLAIGLLIENNVLKDGSNAVIVPREDAITLQLDNGDVEIIAEDGSSQVLTESGRVVGHQKGSQLIYEGDDSKLKLVYNTLSIPNGKRFTIVLSDGTKVHLNSGSSITYPVQFLKESVRKVLLVGEAYFEVAHDVENVFVVNTQELDIAVHGTKFNVANYPEDRNTEVVLLEGSVSLAESAATNSNQNELFLEPGFKGTYNKADKTIINEKVNTALYTSWMNGNLIFRNASFENITQKLERHYNVVIINNDRELAAETFNATIETEHETIEQVFNYFNKVYQIEYSIVENKIVIY